MKISTLLKRPLVTEKSTAVAENGIYTFEVDKRANKEEIKAAFETFFKVKVDSVRTMNCRDRSRRKGQTVSKIKYWKKAVVQLKPGQKIALFEGA